MHWFAGDGLLSADSERTIDAEATPAVNLKHARASCTVTSLSLLLAASIFKRMSEPPSVTPAVSGFADFAQSYKKFHVTRRMAIGRHERVLAIDGDYIHVSGIAPRDLMRAISC